MNMMCACSPFAFNNHLKFECVCVFLFVFQGERMHRNKFLVRRCSDVTHSPNKSTEIATLVCLDPIRVDQNVFGSCDEFPRNSFRHFILMSNLTRFQLHPMEIILSISPIDRDGLRSLLARLCVKLCRTKIFYRGTYCCFTFSCILFYLILDFQSFFLLLFVTVRTFLHSYLLVFCSSTFSVGGGAERVEGCE